MFGDSEGQRASARRVDPRRTALVIASEVCKRCASGEETRTQYNHSERGGQSRTALPWRERLRGKAAGQVPRASCASR